MKEETYNEQIVIIPPEGYKTCKYRDEKGVLHFEFQKFEEQKERMLPKSWEEFCEMFPVKAGEWYISGGSCFLYSSNAKRECKAMLPDRATAEAVLALCQLIQLRNCYNGDWVPDWDDEEQEKYVITFVCSDEITITDSYNDAYSMLYFKNKEIADEFLHYFRPFIEKLKPLYGIKEGGEE